MNLVYLASPYLNRKPKDPKETDSDYYHRSRLIEELRYQQAIDASAYLMKEGISVISPIVATHPIAVKHTLPLGSEYWMKFDEVLLSKCDIIVTLTIDGWKDSPGVQRERTIAHELGLQMRFLTPDPKYQYIYYDDVEMNFECLETS